MKNKTTDWIQTFSGKQVWPLEPDMESLCIEDIAHALSHQCRFAGHTRKFYSVAEHSVRATYLMPVGLELWGLLHDASEAYLVDVPRPLKHSPGMAFYREAEQRLQSMLYAKWGLTGAAPHELAEVDDQLLLTEQRDLLGPQVALWMVKAQPLDNRIVPWTSEKAEQMFLGTFDGLRGLP